MKILVIGSGGREHALVWKIAQSPRVEQVFVTPGNAGTAREPQCENVPIASDDIPALVAFAKSNQIDLTVVGPEVPLARGLADHLRGRGRRVFGPLASAARIESSKAFAKELMLAAGVPTAASATFQDLEAALRYIDGQAEPLVVKASGLAAGKGAVVCATRAEARQALRAMLSDSAFGEAGRYDFGMPWYDGRWYGAGRLRPDGSLDPAWPPSGLEVVAPDTLDACRALR